jgi:hypothetical protein
LRALAGKEKRISCKPYAENYAHQRNKPCDRVLQKKGDECFEKLFRHDPSLLSKVEIILGESHSVEKHKKGDYSLNPKFANNFPTESCFSMIRIQIRHHPHPPQCVSLPPNAEHQERNKDNGLTRAQGKNHFLQERHTQFLSDFTL